VSSGSPILYLQRGSATGQDWQNVARTGDESGTAKIPADPAGSFQYRMVAVDDGTVIATSADASLTVTGQPDNCGICRIGKDVLPSKVPLGGLFATQRFHRGKRGRDRLTVLRQMPVTAGLLSPVNAVQTKRH
jgi:hypothetical protein